VTLRDVCLASVWAWASGCSRLTAESAGRRGGRTAAVQERRNDPESYEPRGGYNLI